MKREIVVDLNHPEGRNTLLAWVEGHERAVFAFRSEPTSGRKNKVKLFGYYYGLVLPMLCDFFDVRDTAGRIRSRELQVMNQVLKAKFLEQEIPDPTTGEPIKIVRDCRDLDTMELSTFVEDVRQWAREFHAVDIPNPNPNWREDIAEEKRSKAERASGREGKEGPVFGPDFD